MNINDITHNLNENMRKAGCSPLFLSSAINSTFFGEVARQHGFSMKLDDMDFREQMTKQNRLDTMINNNIQIDMKRDLFLLGQRYLKMQTSIENEGRRKMVEFQHFDSHCWRQLMATSILAFMKESHTMTGNKSITPIKLFLAKTGVNSGSEMNIKQYADFCDAFHELFYCCPYVDHLPGQWKRTSTSAISETMIVNYVLKGMPTVILFPLVIRDVFRIECATWGFDKGLSSISFLSFFEEKSLGRKLKTDEVLARLALTAGLVVDTYLTVENHMPLFYAQSIRNIVEKYPELADFYNSQYMGLRKAMDVLSDDSYLGSTFSDKALNIIVKSFKNIIP